MEALFLIYWLLFVALCLFVTFSTNFCRFYVYVLGQIFLYVREIEQRCTGKRRRKKCHRDQPVNNQASRKKPPSSPQRIIRSLSFTSKDFVLNPNGKQSSPKVSQQEFHLADCMDYLNAGMEAIIEDSVTQRFIGVKFRSWNLLSRNYYRSLNYGFFTVVGLNLLWLFGFVVRYGILFPGRLCVLILALVYLVTATFLVGLLPKGQFRRKAYEAVSVSGFNMLSRVFSTVVRTHELHNLPTNGICVANHTTPLDIMILSCDRPYTLVGQRHHQGVYSLLQKALDRASEQLIFERSEIRDRQIVAQRLRERVADSENLPILIFPEGTCINNTSVMQFKKGSFEAADRVYPVAIKYHSRFSDAFWDSHQHSATQYIFMLMTSWALVCDVWYLPLMTKTEGEEATDFANRVKAEIAAQCGVVDLPWDGLLKRSKPKKELVAKQQHEYSKRLLVEPSQADASSSSGTSEYEDFSDDA